MKTSSDILKSELSRINAVKTLINEGMRETRQSWKDAIKYAVRNEAHRVIDGRLKISLGEEDD